MEKIKLFICTPLFNKISTSFLIIIYLFFLFNHINAIRNGDISPIAFIFVLAETIIILLLLLRDNPIHRTIGLIPWFFAFAGTILPLFFQPHNTTSINLNLENTLMIIGGLLSIGAYLSLNTSFGITPAVRKVKTNGLYATVRHPIYFSYVITYSGYQLIAFSFFNFFVFIALMGVIAVRIKYEEAILLQNDKYRKYSKAVKYRLFPFIY